MVSHVAYCENQDWINRTNWFETPKSFVIINSQVEWNASHTECQLCKPNFWNRIKIDSLSLHEQCSMPKGIVAYVNAQRNIRWFIQDMCWMRSNVFFSTTKQIYWYVRCVCVYVHKRKALYKSGKVQKQQKYNRLWHLLVYLVPTKRLNLKIRKRKRMLHHISVEFVIVVQMFAIIFHRVTTAVGQRATTSWKLHLNIHLESKFCHKMRCKHSNLKCHHIWN